MGGWGRLRMMLCTTTVDEIRVQVILLAAELCALEDTILKNFM